MASARTSYPPSAFRRPRPGQAPRILGGGRAGDGDCGGCGGGNGFREATSPQLRIPLTVLHGWFDGWGQGDGPGAADSKGRKARGGSGGGGGGSGAGGNEAKSGGAAGGDKSKRKSPGSSSSSSSRSGKSSARRGSEATPSQGGDLSNLFSRVGKLGAGDSGSGSGSSSGNGKVKDAADERGQGRREGVVQTLSAFGESFSETNVTLTLGGGRVFKISSVPWKGVGIYAGGLLSGLGLAVGLLTVPYAELGSPGLRKSLTLFENVLVDIDQVNFKTSSSIFRG